jgi:hypothetical protein
VPLQVAFCSIPKRLSREYRGTGSIISKKDERL